MPFRPGGLHLLQFLWTQILHEGGQSFLEVTWISLVTVFHVWVQGLDHFMKFISLELANNPSEGDFSFQPEDRPVLVRFVVFKPSVDRLKSCEQMSDLECGRKHTWTLLSHITLAALSREITSGENLERFNC